MKYLSRLLLLLAFPLLGGDYTVQFVQITVPGTVEALTEFYVSGPSDGPSDIWLTVQYDCKPHHVCTLGAQAHSTGPGTWSTALVGVKHPVAAWVDE